MNNNIIRTNKKIVRLTESDLRKIVRESIKTTLNEMAYGTDFDDTLKWVQRKKTKYVSLRPRAFCAKYYE